MSPCPPHPHYKRGYLGPEQTLSLQTLVKMTQYLQKLFTSEPLFKSNGL